jgi:AcrR family transcriptional regulator
MTTLHADSRSARERLLDAADALFYREGVHSVGIDRIIAEAGVAKATLYSAFGSKEALIQAYLQRRHERRRERILQALEAYPTPRERMLGIYAVAGDLAAQSGYRGCAFVNASAEAEIENAVRAVCDASRAWIRGLFTELARAAGAARPQRLAEQLVLLYDGASTGGRMDRSRDATTTAQNLALLVLERELGPAPATSASAR